MSPREQLQLLAEYNRSMNQRVFSAAQALSEQDVALDRGAFFGSILGTLNHLAVADTVWLKRFAAHPACSAVLGGLKTTPTPTRLDETLFSSLAGLREYRQRLDALICRFVDEVPEEAFGQTFSYSNMKGVPSTRGLFAVLLHFFNHQTHHRGQVTTLLFQAGVDPGVTDLLPLVPEVQ